MKLSVIGIDVGKTVLHVHGADAQVRGEVLDLLEK